MSEKRTSDPLRLVLRSTEEQLDDRSGEFPRFDERFCMSDYRHGWIVAGVAIVHRDGLCRLG